MRSPRALLQAAEPRLQRYPRSNHISHLPSLAITCSRTYARPITTVAVRVIDTDNQGDRDSNNPYH